MSYVPFFFASSPQGGTPSSAQPDRSSIQQMLLSSLDGSAADTLSERMRSPRHQTFDKAVVVDSKDPGCKTKVATLVNRSYFRSAPKISQNITRRALFGAY